MLYKICVFEDIAIFFPHRGKNQKKGPVVHLQHIFAHFLKKYFFCKSNTGGSRGGGTIWTFWVRLVFQSLLYIYTLGWGFFFLFSSIGFLRFWFGGHFIAIGQGISKLFLIFFWYVYFSNILTSEFGIPCSKVLIFFFVTYQKTRIGTLN